MSRIPIRLVPVLLWLAVAGAAPAAAALPAPFEARYEGHRFPLSAKATLALARHGDFYKYTLRGAVYLGFYRGAELYDCSVMRLQDGALRPLEYLHRDSRKPERNLQTRFDWEAGTARTVRGDGSVLEVALAGKTWDVMSVQVRLRMDVAQGAPGATYDYPVVYRGELRRQQAAIEGRETVETEAGTLTAVRVRSEDPKHTNFFWFAGTYAWLPVQLTVSEVTLELASPPEQAARPPGPPLAQAPSC